NHPPTAAPGGPYSGAEGTAVTFDGSASSDPDGDALTYAWDFGDGATGSGAKPTHSYADNGPYSVTRTVSDTHSATSAPGTTTCSALSCAFTDGSTDADGQVTAWSWSFGDGGTATSQNPSHTYAAGGTYTVTLTVTDNQGATGSTSKSVAVAAPNKPPTAAFSA